MDIKAVLSGLVDDAVDRDTRHEAERHLAACKPCRTLVNEAEGLNALIAADGQSLIATRLPDGFEDSVLARTVYPQTYKFRQRRRMWTNSIGWMAAAACLGLAGLIWVQQQQQHNDQRAQAPNDVPRVNREEAIPPSGPTPYVTSASLQSRTFDGDLPMKTAEPTVSEEDADTLYATSVVLHMLHDADLSNFADVDRVRRIAEYDDLLDRLATTRQRLPERDRAAVFAAEGVLARTVIGPMSQHDLRDLHDTVSRMNLPAVMSELSNRQSASSL